MEHDRAREILEEYVSTAKLMQVATLSEDGLPALCHVWYGVRFRPDRLYFISRPDRNHSASIRRGGRVAGGIVNIVLEGLGQKVTGVTFKGAACELKDSTGDGAAIFLSRWPGARPSITADASTRNLSPPSRVYEIRVSEWVLFDEQDFPDSPRRVLLGLEARG